jgi:squalene cyclase
MLVKMEFVRQAVSAAENYLANAQDSDGFWRDYDLAPGQSTAWITGCVGWSLSKLSMNGGKCQVVNSARAALCSIHRPDGWGYNSGIAPDADTTAWVLRLMANVGDPFHRDATRYLQPFITESGGVRTFHHPERFGSWAQEHADVTPVAGLALVECAGDPVLVSRLRGWSLAQQRQDGAWSSFWWATDAYATARNLEFLESSGGVPSGILESCIGWLDGRNLTKSAFEGAQQLIIRVTVGMREAQVCAQLVDALLGLQMGDGSWPASSVLRIPNQKKQGGDQLYGDNKRLMTTAMMVHALKLWLLGDMVEARATS